jgi:DnaJ family protein A protein 2
MEDYYKILGVERGADAEAVRRAFRTLAKKHHPDKGGDAEKFKAISKAANVLQDPQLRAIYDQHGEQGIHDHQQNGAAHHHHHHRDDIFHQQHHQVRVIVVSVSLEEIYSGVEKTSTFEWDKPCDECGTTGCKPGKSGQKCYECRGQGMIVRVLKLAPNMIQQSQMICPTCQGQGIHIHDHDRCNKCQGMKKYRHSEQVLIRVHRGTQHKQRLFPVSENIGQQLESQGIVFVAEQIAHPRYERRGKQGEHIVIKQTISLLEALTGATFCIFHLDSTRLQVTTPEGHVTKPGDLYRLTHQGMPISKHEKNSQYSKVESQGYHFV